MSKWADYLISAVAYDPGRQIISLKRHKDHGDSIGSGEITDKVSVASDINNGISYMTVYSTLSNWKLGQKIRAPRVDSTVCLRIDDNRVKYDNLGSIQKLDGPGADAPPKRPARASGGDGKISSRDKAMLKHMGAKRDDSAGFAEAAVPSGMPKELAAKSKGESLAEYEEDYLKRLKIRAKIRPAESPHRALPKFEDKPEPIESPHRALPKGFERPKEKPAESPHRALPKDTAPAGKKGKTAADGRSRELKDIKKQIGDLKKAVGKLDSKGGPALKKPPAIEAYCVKCRTKRRIKSPTRSKIKDGRPAIRGTCPKCGAKMCRIGRPAKAA